MKTLLKQFHSRQDRESGISLVAVLIAVGIMGLVASLMSDLFTKSFKSQADIEERLDLTAMKRSLLDSFSCAQTLGSPPIEDLPLDCGDFRNIVLRNNRGDAITFTDARNGGSWRAGASCRNDELVMRLVPPAGTDTNIIGLNRRSLLTRNIFEGMKFCSDFFVPRPANIPPKAFGGTFQLRVRYDPSQGKNVVSNTCRINNAYTNACTCPSGYFASPSFDFVTGSSASACNRWYGDGLPASIDRCGVQSYLCMPFE